jgi:hypothetical protein
MRSKSCFPILLVLSTLFFNLNMASATDIERRKGMGFARAIGGPSGLAINYGLGSLGLEAIIGMSRFSHADGGPEPRLVFGAGLGAHFHLLNSQNAALTVGGRVNFATGTADVDGAAVEVTQVGFDVPLRVYWFPTRHISIHSEFGLAIMMGAEDGILIQARDGDGALESGGLAIIAFRQSTPVGQLGLTYWW